MIGDFEVMQDYVGRAIRLTLERWEHILDHPEMTDQRLRIIETVSKPQIVIATHQDASVHAYHRLYERTPVTRKYLIVVVKIEVEDAFIVTAFYSSRLKKGETVWTA